MVPERDIWWYFYQCTKRIYMWSENEFSRNIFQSSTRVIGWKNKSRNISSIAQLETTRIDKTHSVHSILCYLRSLSFPKDNRWHILTNCQYHWSNNHHICPGIGGVRTPLKTYSLGLVIRPFLNAIVIGIAFLCQGRNFFSVICQVFWITSRNPRIFYIFINLFYGAN